MTESRLRQRKWKTEQQTEQKCQINSALKARFKYLQCRIKMVKGTSRSQVTFFALL